MGVTKRAMWCAVLLILSACALWIPRLSLSLWGDEVITVTSFAISPLHAFGDYSEPNNHMLYSGLVWLVTRVLPTAPLVVRLPSFYAGVLALAMLYRVARQSLPALPSWVAVAWMASTNLATAASDARGYSLSILLTLAIWWFSVEYARPRAVLWLAMASMLTLPTMILYLGSVGVWALRWRRVLLPPLIIGTFAGSLFYLPALYYGLITRHLTIYGNPEPFALLTEIASVAGVPMILLTTLLVSVRGRHAS